jgi:uncharacterized protein (TIGR00730 family)
VPTGPASRPDDRPARLERICVFCGSSVGRDPAFAAAAGELGRALAQRGVTLVYGGGSAGLMGALATAALDAGGHVIGVLPAGLFPDGVTASPLRDHHRGTFELEQAADMHARKARFHELSDGYVVLPGGLGTLEEMAEVATWAQIGLHDDPIGFLDVGGFYDDLFAFFDRTVADGFVRPANREQLYCAPTVGELLDLLEGHEPRVEPKWIDP